MEFRNFFKNSSNEIYKQNMDLLEEYDLITPFGSPNKLFLKFINSKNLKIKEDEFTEDLIEEFEYSMDSMNLKLEKNERQKEIIFKQKKVWINVFSNGKWTGTDLILEHDRIIVELTGEEFLYAELSEINIEDAESFKKKITIDTYDGEFVFEINEDNAIPLKEILEDNTTDDGHDEFDDLLELYDLYAEGKISHEEYELRKAMIYVDERYCTNCGAKLDADSEFCSGCGHVVED